MKRELEKLYSHIDDIEIAMTTTRRADGHLQSRAMATLKRAEGADVCSCQRCVMQHRERPVSAAVLRHRA